eukprot:gnl/MRDRNA2_/MRDRNA2_20304_c0_seq2.p1 gnl/MRDRNA2_/MRDRNA2_20304_c0~~gnl/MRDRNA2_/MRDRNA2_20304_c0_seq2.p1  ORF type:complete len:203 (+),score=22.44 gnl/MRDRNA2_/MRDRNA2_20304_c0_seq2:65-673(+)
MVKYMITVTKATDASRVADQMGENGIKIQGKLAESFLLGTKVEVPSHTAPPKEAAEDTSSTIWLISGSSLAVLIFAVVFCCLSGYLFRQVVKKRNIAAVSENGSMAEVDELPVRELSFVQNSHGSPLYSNQPQAPINFVQSPITFVTYHIARCQSFQTYPPPVYILGPQLQAPQRQPVTYHPIQTVELKPPASVRATRVSVL